MRSPVNRAPASDYRTKVTAAAKRSQFLLDQKRAQKAKPATPTKGSAAK